VHLYRKGLFRKNVQKLISSLENKSATHSGEGKKRKYLFFLQGIKTVAIKYIPNQIVAIKEDIATLFLVWKKAFIYL
jgi:hypothetical protein